MFLLCFLINCIKLIKETAVSACVFGYHRKKQARNLCLRDAVLTGGLLIIGTFIETEFLHENAIVLVVITPMIRNTFGGSGKNILTACILLGIMILPTIISVSESAIRAVPESYYEGALALGDTHERSVFKAVLPAAKSGILAAIILGIGRAIGETMAVIMIAGNHAVMPDSLLAGVRTLTSNIVLELGYATDLHREALIATGVVLFVFILIINLLFSVVKKKGAK